MGARAVEPYVYTLTALAGASVVLAYAIATNLFPWPPAALALLAACIAGNTLLQRRGFVLYWRGQRVVSTIDEPVVYLALALLPLPATVLVVFVGSTIAQVIGRRAAVKKLFNISAYTLATLPAIAIVAGPSFAGVPPPLAALPAVLAYTITSNLILSGLFARLEGETTLHVYKQRFLGITLVHSLIGACFGFAAVVLWAFHPLAVLVLGPMAILSLGFARLGASAEREIRVRRRIQEMDAALVGTADEERVAESVLSACTDMFVAGAVVLTLKGQDGEERSWRRDQEGGTGAGAPLIAPIPGLTGNVLGQIAIHPSARVRELLGPAEAPLLSIVASRAGTAIESARAVHDLVVLKDLHEEIVQGVPAGVLRIDHTGRILQANAFLVRALGEAEPPSPTMTVFEWPPLRALPEFEPALRGLVEGNAFHDVDLQLNDMRGTKFEAAGVPLRDGGVILFSDVTAHHQAQEAVRSQTLTRPFVRRLVLSLVGGLNVPRSAISSVGRSLARELALTDVEEFAGAFRAMGLGNLQFDRRDGDKYFFSADDLLERRSGASQPTCHLALGFLEGAVAAAHQGSSLGTELRCQSQGRSQCTFVVQARAETEPQTGVRVPSKHVVSPSSTRTSPDVPR